MSHLSRAIEIIAQTDEDDALEAERSLVEKRCDGMYVLIENGKVLGLTGAFPANGVDDIMWLSWTYLDEDCHGDGLGNYMVSELLNGLSDIGIRKVFIASSDYKEDGKLIYEQAHAFYESLGAKLEMTIPSYHDTGEAKLVYGLGNPNVEPVAQSVVDVATGVKFTKLEDADESVSGAALHWALAERGCEGLGFFLKEAKTGGARAVFASLPQDVSNMAYEDFIKNGFTSAGELKDYYDVGVSEIWWYNILKS